MLEGVGLGVNEQASGNPYTSPLDLSRLCFLLHATRVMSSRSAGTNDKIYSGNSIQKLYGLQWERNLHLVASLDALYMNVL